MGTKTFFVCLGILWGVSAWAISGQDARVARETLPPSARCVDVSNPTALTSAIRESGMPARDFFELGIVAPWIESNGYALFFEGRLDSVPARGVWVPLNESGRPTGTLALENLTSRYALNLDLVRGMGKEIPKGSSRVSNEALLRDWKRFVGFDQLAELGAKLRREFPELDENWVKAVIEDRSNLVMSQYLGISPNPTDRQITSALSRNLEFSRQLWKLNSAIAPGQPGAGLSCKKWILESVQFLLQAARRQRR